MIFRRSRKKVKDGIGGMDKLITGMIIGGAAASIFGLSRTPKGKKLTAEYSSGARQVSKKCIRGFGRFTAKCVSFFEKK